MDLKPENIIRVFDSRAFPFPNGSDHSEPANHPNCSSSSSSSAVAGQSHAAIAEQKHTGSWRYILCDLGLVRVFCLDHCLSYFKPTL